ncbi:hypothetical protein HMN09_00571600 [Mycena chlorophos]|uniref:MARVEL domain-containing protein n=1 Tax=Mycena chlorophos TaxID=658473 RepID=A0A8H6TE58_MYCCL|nr:hypothetical protein HMN09_00571600 [Mycena chlorophos]
MAALARAVLTTTLLTCTAVRPLAVFSNTHMLIIMFSCVFYACAYDGFALFALPSWLAPAVDPKIVDIQFQAFASVCCAIAGTLFLVTAIYFSVFPAEARRVIAERGESWWWPERRSGAEGEDAPTIWNILIVFSQAGLSGWTAGTAFNRAWGVGFALLTLFALLSVGMGAYLMQYFDFTAAVAIAAGVLTLLTVPLMIILEAVKPNKFFTSAVLFEAIWLTLLSIIWLVSGGVNAVWNIGGDFSCDVADAIDDGISYADSDDDIDYASGTIGAVCSMPQVLTAFSFASWVLLFFYVMSTMICACVSSSRRQARAWTGSVANLLGEPEVKMEDGASKASQSSTYPVYAATPGVDSNAQKERPQV